VVCIDPTVLRRNQVFDYIADQFLAIVAEHFRGHGIRQNNRSVSGYLQDAVGSRFE
jgi:hypothetical protein